MSTIRQRDWQRAASEAPTPAAAALFILIAQPSPAERGGHYCPEHAIGFTRDGRKGLKCGVCREVVRWLGEAA